MSFLFLFSNLHFALEVLGALVFLMAAWLAFDSYTIRKDFLTGSRGIGFLLLSVAQVIHSVSGHADSLEYAMHGLFIGGLSFVLLNLILERPVDRPSLKGVFLLPPLAITGIYADSVTAGLFLLCALFSFWQYHKESKKILAPFFTGFFFLFLGRIAATYYAQDQFSVLWIAGHIAEIIGFLALAVWVLKYLHARMREEIVLLFVSMALFISIAVTFAFSFILINQVNDAVRANLSTNARVLDYTLDRLRQESLAKAELLAASASLKKALHDKDFTAVEDILSEFMVRQGLGFLTITDTEGTVLLRAHALTQKSDSIASEPIIQKALAGKSAVTVASAPNEAFSVRAAAPVVDGTALVGVVVAGFPLDDPFVDNIKRITGLDMSIYEKDRIVASTIFNENGQTRISGTLLNNPRVFGAVIGRGETVTLDTAIVSQPFLASYLPIKNDSGAVVGMVSAGRSQHEIAEIATAANVLTLATVAAIILILIMPIYVVTKKLSE